MEHTVTGEIIVIGEVQTFASGFSKRLLVVKTKETYAQEIPLEFFKDKCGLLDALKIGQTVTVAFNLLGSEHNGRYYANLNGWRIESVEQASHTPQHVEPIKAKVQGSVDDVGEDDLPF